MPNFDAFFRQLKFLSQSKGGLELLENEPMARHTTMSVGGAARFLVIAHDVDAIQSLWSYFIETKAPNASLENISSKELITPPWILVGGGANLIFPDTGFNGVVVKLGDAFKQLEETDGMIKVGSARPLPSLVSRRPDFFSHLFGIPGSVGGALAGNAGTVFGDICSVVHSVWVLNDQAELIEKKQSEFDYRYRQTSLKKTPVLFANFTPGPTPDVLDEEIKIRIEAAKAKRAEQPPGRGTSGCMFRNPKGDFAGRLIDAAGFKGVKRGGVCVSEKHANFMLNDGSATAEDVLNLVKHVHCGVKQKFDVELELEVVIVGLDFPLSHD